MVLDFSPHLTQKGTPNPLDRAEPPKRTRGDIADNSDLLSAYRRDLEKVSEILKDGKSVFSGPGRPTCPETETQKK